jgi:hypothetical protein
MIPLGVPVRHRDLHPAAVATAGRDPYNKVRMSGKQDAAAASIPIFISAGEDSGDLYGSLLIQALRQRLGNTEFFGCGGEKMRIPASSRWWES